MVGGWGEDTGTAWWWVSAFVVGEDYEGVVGSGGVVELVCGAGLVFGELVEGAAGGGEDYLGGVGQVVQVASGGPGRGVIAVAVEGERLAVGAGNKVCCLLAGTHWMG